MEGRKKFKEKYICIIFSIIFSTFIFLQVSYAADIQVTKSSVSQIKIGDILEVTISINSLESSTINVTVKEIITDADPIDPPTFNIVKCPPGVKFCAEPPYYLWDITLLPLSSYTITYKIKPLSFGSFTIPPTEVQTSSGEIFYSNSLNIFVKPETNGICEPELGEDYLNNPDDCPSGSKDNVCDLIKDGRCDPDCIPTADPDCTTTTTTKITTTTIQLCNKNNVCEPNLGENEETCPQDCKKPSLLWVYIIVGIVIISLLTIFFKNLQGRKIESHEQIPY